ncbi:MAG: cytochrome c [Alphaproteobacteria bacterium]|nr:cytochrome c [Alphaproteobacteria bacterium]
MLRWIALAALIAPAALAQPSPARQAELRHLVLHDCGSCHGLTMKGGLGRPLLPEALADKPDGFLVEVILGGVPGTPMPPWREELSASEARWIVEQLRKGNGDAR